MLILLEEFDEVRKTILFQVIVELLNFDVLIAAHALAELVDVAGHLVCNFDKRVCNEHSFLVEHLSSGLVSGRELDKVVERGLQQMEGLERDVLFLKTNSAL